MNITCLSLHEVQLLRLSYSVKDLATLFKITEPEVYFVLKECGIKSPTDYVRDEVPRFSLMEEICYFGHKKVAEKYFVSEAFLRSLFVCPEEHGVNFLQDQVERFGSVTVVKKMYSYKGTLQPPSPENRFRGLGGMNSRVGRKCELKVIEWLSTYTECHDVNEYNPTADHDIFCDLYGRLNVKAVSGSRCWRFPKAENCEYVVGVGIHQGEPLFAVLIPPVFLPDTFYIEDILRYTHKLFKEVLIL